jgi:hypothetical protein
MRSFSLKPAVWTDGILACLFAGTFLWWANRIRGIDLGLNDFAGLFYGGCYLLLLCLAVPTTICALVAGLRKPEDDRGRTRGWLALILGSIAAILVATGLFL